MFLLHITVRQVLLAALLFCGPATAGNIAVEYDSDSGDLEVSGLSALQRSALAQNPERAYLQRKDAVATAGMAISIRQNGHVFNIHPTFPLRHGETYRLKITLGETDIFETEVKLPKPEGMVADLVWYAPDAPAIPANTLRLYLMFSEPMARGQARQAIQLIRADGTIVNSPFLNLEHELWDPGQRRLTLLLDPGRIKRGVGPNLDSGAALVEGEQYELVISSEMTSADGVALGEELRLPVHVGPPERRKLSLKQWRLMPPKHGSQDTLLIDFGRLVDRAAAERLIRVLRPDGTPVKGRTETDGKIWKFIPSAAWTVGHARVVIDPAVEDVAGNSFEAPFDKNITAADSDANPAQSLEIPVFGGE